MLRILVYTAGTLLTCYLSVIYRSPVLLTLFWFEILLVLPMALLAWIGYRSISAEIKIPVTAAEKGKTVTIDFLFRNKSVLFYPNVYADIEYQNCFEKKVHRKRIKISLNGKSTGRYSFEYREPVCGNTLFSIQRVRCYDWLHLFYFRNKNTDSQILTVIPKMQEVFLDISRQVQEFQGEDNEFDVCTPGDDPSEIFQIREYRPGDRVQRVHWKITARTDEIMVKDYSRPTGCPILLALHVWNAQENWENADASLETIFSLSISLIEEKCYHYLVWFDSEKNAVSRSRIEELEDIYEAMGRIFQMKIPTERVQLEELYQQEYPNEPYLVYLSLENNLQLYRNGELITTISAENPEKMLHEMEVTI